MPQILKEAAGTAPMPASDTPGRKAIRVRSVSLLEENKSYQAESERYFVQGHLRNLMYANTFVDSNSRQAILAELQQLKQLDQRHLAAMQLFPEMFKQNLTAAGASAENVAAFERGMQEGLRGGALDLDLKWIDAVSELYLYADQNQSHMTSSRYAQVQFDSDELRAQFVYLSDKVKETGQQRDNAMSEFENRQKQNRQRIGLTSQDVGRNQ